MQRMQCIPKCNAEVEVVGCGGGRRAHTDNFKPEFSCQFVKKIPDEVFPIKRFPYSALTNGSRIEPGHNLKVKPYEVRSVVLISC